MASICHTHARCGRREREQQRQSKHASAEQGKPKKEPAADSAAAQPAQAAVLATSTDVEDSWLPGAHLQPPSADPVGSGLLTSQQISGTCLQLMIRSGTDLVKLNPASVFGLTVLDCVASMAVPVNTVGTASHSVQCCTYDTTDNAHSGSSHC